MSFTRTSRDRDEPPFGPAVVKRGLPITYVIEEQAALTSAWTGKDISGVRWTYQLRTWTSDDDAAVLDDQTVGKGTDAASGELDYYYSCGTTVRDTLLWEIVEVDNSNADSNTLSNFRERIIDRWFQPILDAP